MPLPPLTLYLHFPWCVRKCPYCDFNSHPAGATIDEARYVDALVADLDFELPLLEGEREIDAIFLGGGTPSLFTADALDELLGQVGARVRFARDIEITMEANPGASEHSAFKGYRSAGINRLSLGVQSFDPSALKTLGRIHSPRDVVDAFDSARDAGFDNINLDLMYGLPAQDIRAAMTDLTRAIGLGPEHLSLYQLTLEPNTVFHRYPPVLPGDEAIFSIQQTLLDELDAAEFDRYEISAYARDGRRCRHNLNYWRFGDYIGIGAGAHGKLTGADGSVIRRARKRHPAGYMAAAGRIDALAEQRAVTTEDIGFEFLMNALRLKDGFPLALAHARTGLSEQQLLTMLDPVMQKQLVQRDQDRLRCSDRGYLFLDDILASLLPQ